MHTPRTPRPRSAISEPGPLGPDDFLVEICSLSGDKATIVVTTHTRLREIQEKVVRWSGASFPRHQAALCDANGSLFDDFNDRPFLHAIQGDVFNVVIDITRDPYFFDLADRRKRERR